VFLDIVQNTHIQLFNPPSLLQLRQAELGHPQNLWGQTEQNFIEALQPSCRPTNIVKVLNGTRHHPNEQKYHVNNAETTDD